MTKSQVITARIPQDLYKKVKYLEINVTEVVRHSLNEAVIEREAEVNEMLESLPEMRIIGGLKNPLPKDPLWEQIRESSGEEKKLAVIRYLRVRKSS